MESQLAETAQLFSSWALRTRKLKVDPAWHFLQARIAVEEARAFATGWLVTATFDVASSNKPVDAASVDAERDQIRAAIAQPSPSSCTDDSSTEVTIGDLRFGPNNEIVKFLVSVGKFTQAMADRIGHEVSTDKLKEWARDPAGSFERSDPGKAVDTVVRTVTKLIENYCAHNWCP